MKKNPFRPLAVLSALFASAAVSLAHQMWIEPAAEDLMVRFGDFGDALEKSPGYLDQLAPVQAWAFSAEGKPSDIEAPKKADGFLLTAVKLDAPAQAQTAFPVMGKEGAPGKWPWFYLRWHPAGLAAAAVPATPSSTLDIVPEGEGKVRVFFRGKPLANAAIILRGPEETEKDLTADAEGRLTVTLDKPGAWLVTCNHKEPLAGFAGGKEFDTTSHNASLAVSSK